MVCLNYLAAASTRFSVLEAQVAAAWIGCMSDGLSLPG
jgi:hypothetical protein